MVLGYRDNCGGTSNVYITDDISVAAIEVEGADAFLWQSFYYLCIVDTYLNNSNRRHCCFLGITFIIYCSAGLCLNNTKRKRSVSVATFSIFVKYL